MRFLIDQNADFFGNELKKLGHEVEYVTELRKKDERFRNDRVVINHTEANHMILVTKDRENGQACQDDKIPCIWLSDERLFEEMVIPQLKELEKPHDSSR
jgi:predicted nuclease of predicted toxin-antitoxin system